MLLVLSSTSCVCAWWRVVGKDCVLVCGWNAVVAVLCLADHDDDADNKFRWKGGKHMSIQAKGKST